MTPTHAADVRAARAARVRSIRQRVIAGAVALFVATWLLITLMLVTGHDPALAHQSAAKSVAAKTTTTNTQTNTQTNTSTNTNASTTSSTSNGATSSSTGGSSSVTSSQS